MGHLMPFLRLALMLQRHGCSVTLITAQPTTSKAESAHISSFLSAFPQVDHFELQLLPMPEEFDTSTVDPFFLQFDRINRSIHQLLPILKEFSPPLSAIFLDLTLVANFVEIADELGLPIYIPNTSSARFFALLSYLPELSSQPDFLRGAYSDVAIPGILPLPFSSIPPPFKDTSTVFTSTLIRNSRTISKARGILMNNFEWFEESTLAALNGGRVLETLPPCITVGPLEPYKLGNESSENWPWLDEQSSGSVIYVSFGSRTAMSTEQIRELAKALKNSKHKFLWTVKTSKVDKDDKEDLSNVLGDRFLEETAGKGITLKQWVDQEAILAHPAVGGFISHCGWNSVMEAAREGVPILAWPLHGDQRVNAEVVADAGLGIWDRGWGIGDKSLVRADEIEGKIELLMTDTNLRASARRVKEEAAKAVCRGGSSDRMIRDVVKCLVG
ncbi:hypothetical protein MLD38_022544 [Melastoma candidum]|nr:hypothetical protein MLD38_022544 [Melastoma candidum]